MYANFLGKNYFFWSCLIPSVDIPLLWTFFSGCSYSPFVSLHFASIIFRDFPLPHLPNKHGDRGVHSLILSPLSFWKLTCSGIAISSCWQTLRIFADPTYQGLPSQDKLSTAQEFNHEDFSRRVDAWNFSIHLVLEFKGWVTYLRVTPWRRVSGSPVRLRPDDLDPSEHAIHI